MSKTLEHHGIKGMRWGVRRTPEQLGHIREGFNNVASISRESSNVVRKFGRSSGSRKGMNVTQLTNQELQERVKRYNLEKQYTQLTEADTKKGAAYALSALEVVGSLAVIGASATSIAIAIRQLRG